MAASAMRMLNVADCCLRPIQVAARFGGVSLFVHDGAFDFWKSFFSAVALPKWKRPSMAILPATLLSRS